MSGFSYIHSLATEAAQEFYGRDNYESYGESEILRRPIETELPDEPQIRVPLGLMGRFSVNGDGVTSAFVSNGRSQDQARAFGLGNVQDCALAGQYLLDSIDWPIQFHIDDVEDFAISEAEENERVRLLAGIQVSYDVGKDDLVPSLVYDRRLGNILFRERAAVCSGLLLLDKCFEDISESTHYGGELSRAVMRPTEANIDFFAETAAQGIARDMPIDVTANGS